MDGNPDEDSLRSRQKGLCELLVDYVSAGHFEVFHELINEAESFGDGSCALAEKLMPNIGDTTEVIHPALGTWHYGAHSREITADGFCTLRMGNEIIWKRRAISKSADGFVLEGNLGHQLKGDTLHIEGRYQAKKKQK